jgi:hypothetical protein
MKTEIRWNKELFFEEAAIAGENVYFTEIGFNSQEYTIQKAGKKWEIWHVSKYRQGDGKLKIEEPEQIDEAKTVKECKQKVAEHYAYAHENDDSWDAEQDADKYAS